MHNLCMTNEISIHQIPTDSSVLRQLKIQHSLDCYTGYKNAAMIIITRSTVYRRFKDYKENGKHKVLYRKNVVVKLEQVIC
jgi:hypothetical protein